jgi:uncharacterized protein with PIN domain
MIVAVDPPDMARCPTCETGIKYVQTELIELRGYEDVVESRAEKAGGGQAIATVCPECESILSL